MAQGGLAQNLGQPRVLTVTVGQTAARPVV